MEDQGLSKHIPQSLAKDKIQGFFQTLEEQTFTLADPPALIDAVKSDDRVAQGYGTIGIRKLISTGKIIQSSF